MKNITILALVATVATMALLASCGGTKGKSSSDLSFTDTKWQLVQIAGVPFDAKDDAYTLSFSGEDRVTGKGDCNRLMGGYKALKGHKIELSGFAGTRMMCPDQIAEDAFLKALEGVNSYKIDGDMLTLMVDRIVVLKFRAI